MVGGPADALVFGFAEATGADPGRSRSLPRGPAVEERGDLAAPGIFEMACDPVDLEDERRKLNEGHEHPVTDFDLASYLMYPKVFSEFRRHREEFGDVSVLPTHVYFYGMRPEEEIVVTMKDGRRVVIRYLAMGDTDDRGYRRVFFEANGQPSSVLVQDRSSESAHHENEKVDTGNPKHVGAPMPGLISTIAVEVSASRSRRAVRDIRLDLPMWRAARTVQYWPSRVACRSRSSAGRVT